MKMVVHVCVCDRVYIYPVVCVCVSARGAKEAPG